MQAVPWRICAAGVADAPAIAAARYRSQPEADAAIGHYTRWLQAKLQRDEYIGALARVGNELIAGAGATLLDWGPRSDTGPVHTVARITNVFTLEAWRRRGLARALTQAVLDECRARGLVHVMLAATDMGQPLYQRLGFDFKRNEMALRLTVDYAPPAPATSRGSS